MRVTYLYVHKSKKHQGMTRATSFNKHASFCEWSLIKIQILEIGISLLGHC